MYEHFSQKIRKTLNSPLRQKGILFWLLSPLLFYFSFLIFIISWIRRKIGYTRFDTSIQNIPENLTIICIGNIIMGGTGKTPVVKAIAEHYLNEDYNVAIASRGINKEAVTINNLYRNESLMNKLSDENREILELLNRAKTKNKKFVIYQNKNRKHSLNLFIKLIVKSNQKSVFLLDDGLQHFSCPRHINLCLWQTKLLQNSPLLPFPIGCFREGMGTKGFAKLLTGFEKRIWSRTTEKAKDSYKREIEKTLNQFNILLNNDVDLIVKSTLALKKIVLKESYFDLIDTCLPIKQPILITGIANPYALLQDLNQIGVNFSKENLVFLEDHGGFPKSLHKKNYFNHGNALILTFKDFCRWLYDTNFHSFLNDNKILKENIFVCYLDIEMETMNDKIFQISELKCLDKTLPHS